MKRRINDTLFIVFVPYDTSLYKKTGLRRILFLLDDRTALKCRAEIN